MTNQSSKNDRPDPEYIIPDEIIVDDRSDDSNTIPDNLDETNHNQDPHFETDKNNAISLRLLCFLGFLFSILFGLAMLFVAIVGSALALATLLNHNEINRNAMKYWKLYMHAVISGVCCLVGIFFPPVGLSLLLVYLSTSDGSENNSTVLKMMKKIFGSFFR